MWERNSIAKSGHSGGNRALALGSTDTVELGDFPPDVFERPEPEMTYDEALKAFKRDLIGRALARSGGDYKEAAVFEGDDA